MKPIRITIESDKHFTEEQAAEFRKSTLSSLQLISNGRVTEVVFDMPVLATVRLRTLTEAPVA